MRHLTSKELEQIIDNLMLHFKWIEKHLLKRLLRSVRPSPSKEHTCQRSFSKISTYIVQHTNPLNIVRKCYSKLCTSFLPYFDENQLNMNQIIADYENITQLMIPIGDIDPSERIKRLHITISARNAEMKSRISHLYGTDLSWTQNVLNICHDNEILPEFQENFTEFVTKSKGFERTVVTDITTLQDEVDKFKTFTVDESDYQLLAPMIEMLPIVEYFTLKSVNRIQTVANDDHNKLNSLFVGARSIGIPTLQLIQLNTPTESEIYETCTKLWSTIYSLIQSDYNHGRCDEITKVFSNRASGEFYRNFTSYQSKLLRNLQQFAMQSICLQPALCFGKDFDVAAMPLTYNGPLLTNCVLAMMFDDNGAFRHKGLGELGVWEISLWTMSKVFWNNLDILQPSFDFE